LAIVDSIARAACDHDIPYGYGRYCELGTEWSDVQCAGDRTNPRDGGLATGVGAKGIGSDCLRASALAHPFGDTEAAGMSKAVGTHGGGGAARAARIEAQEQPQRRPRGCRAQRANRVREAAGVSLAGGRAGAPGGGSGSFRGGALERICRAFPPLGLQGGLRLPAALFHPLGRAALGLRAALRCRQSDCGARALDRLERTGAAVQPAPGRQQQSLSDFPPCSDSASL